MIPLYRERDTLYNGLHPASVLLITLAITVVGLVVSNPLIVGFTLLGLILMVMSAEVIVPWWFFARISIYLGIAAVVINALVSREGTHIIWTGPRLPVLGELNITLEAIFYGLGMALKLALIVGAFGFLTLVLDPDRLLGIFSWRNSRSALLTSFSIKLVPSTAIESRELIDAQRSRGIVRDSGSRWERLKSRLPLLKGLMVTSLDRAVGLAESMESRAFGHGRRTRYRRLEWSAGDWILTGGAILIIGLGITSVVTGSGSYNFYPTATSPFTSGWLLFAAGIAGTLALLVIIELGWKNWTWLRLRT